MQGIRRGSNVGGADSLPIVKGHSIVLCYEMSSTGLMQGI